MIACVDGEKEKKKRLEESGIEIITVPQKEKMVDLKKLMEILGEKGIDSVFLEGGGGLNESALRAGIVSRIYAFLAPKIFGGTKVKTPVEGYGVSFPEEAVLLKLKEVEMMGEDLLLTYDVKGEA